MAVLLITIKSFVGIKSQYFLDARMLLKVNLMQSNDKRLAIDITDWFGSLLYFMNSSFQKSIDIILIILLQI